MCNELLSHPHVWCMGRCFCTCPCEVPWRVKTLEVKLQSRSAGAKWVSAGRNTLPSSSSALRQGGGGYRLVAEGGDVMDETPIVTSLSLPPGTPTHITTMLAVVFTSCSLRGIVIENTSLINYIYTNLPVKKVEALFSGTLLTFPWRRVGSVP